MSKIKLNEIIAKQKQMMAQMKSKQAEQDLKNEIAALEKEATAILPYIQAGIDSELHQQKLTDVMLSIEALKGNI